MAAHSCAMGGPLLWWRCEVAEHDGDTPLQAACYAILDDPERTLCRNDGRLNGGPRKAGGRVGMPHAAPHFASVVSPVGYQT